MLDCWHFKADHRPSFVVINERLNIILAKYELQRKEQMKMLDMEKLLNGDGSSTISTQFGGLKSVTPGSLAFTNLKLSNLKSKTPLMTTSELPRRVFNPSSSNNLSINPIAGEQAPESLMSSSSNSSSIMTIMNSNLLNRDRSLKSSTMGSVMGMSTKTGSTENGSKRITRQSDSEDSQYFSGADTSLVYADSSNFSTASSSVYSNYSVPLSTAAVKAASIMAASLAQAPPSPPPLKPLSRLLNVASAAYQL